MKKLLEYVREGDTVTVESYSRFARNTRDLLNLVHELDEKHVAFISLKEQIDTSTPHGRLMMHIFASLAEFEREQTLQRQAEGIAEAKKAGKYKGRKPIDVDTKQFRIEVEAAQRGEQTHQEAMAKLHLKPNTYYRKIKQLQLTDSKEESIKSIYIVEREDPPVRKIHAEVITVPAETITLKTSCIAPDPDSTQNETI